MAPHPARPYDHASYRHEIHAFAGNGLRPYSPVHLTAVNTTDGVSFAWIRRARTDAESWELADIPLAEEQEVYRVHVKRTDGTVLRTADVTESTWVYSQAMQQVDGIAGNGVFEVAQVSARFGAGPSARLEFGV